MDYKSVQFAIAIYDKFKVRIFFGKLQVQIEHQYNQETLSIA